MSGRWWHLDHRSTPTSFAAPGGRGAASRRIPSHPVAADGCIPHHLDRFITRHGHGGGGGRGSRKRVKEGEKARTSGESVQTAGLAGWLAGWPVCRRPKGSHCRLALDAINHFATVYAIHYLRGGPLYLRRSLISYTVCTHMQMRIVWLFSKLGDWRIICIINNVFLWFFPPSFYFRTQKIGEPILS